MSAGAAPPDPHVILVDQHVKQLLEHFECVQIFVSSHMPEGREGTLHLERGGGNWYARSGQIRDWVQIQDEETRIRVQANSDE
jgi:hypothetical protein